MAAFTALAETGGSYGPFESDVTVVYNKVVTNIGDAYSSSSGIFSAPAAGVYYFVFFYHAGRDKAAKLSLYKNHQEIVKTSNVQADNKLDDNGGNAAILELVSGDQVYMCMEANSHVQATGQRTSFSGFLVRSL